METYRNVPSHEEFRCFLQFLKENDITLRKYLSRCQEYLVKHYEYYSLSYIDYIDILFYHFNDIINYSFTWSETQEGYDYWEIIGHKWRIYYQSNK